MKIVPNMSSQSAIIHLPKAFPLGIYNRLSPGMRAGWPYATQEINLKVEGLKGEDHIGN
jgi:hypothetical protein